MPSKSVLADAPERALGYPKRLASNQNFSSLAWASSLLGVQHHLWSDDGLHRERKPGQSFVVTLSIPYFYK